VEAEGVDDQVEHEHDPEEAAEEALLRQTSLGDDEGPPDARQGGAEALDPAPALQGKLTLRRMSRREAGHRIATRLNTPWQKVISDLADKAAIGVISGRASSLDELR
ncbi:hypothetical protein L6R46_23965, partial [Myxococcota bacterium]|nr:hypothetical protein [Myxococcota bacterium]